MKHKILEAMLFALPLTLAIPAFASPPEEPPAEGEAPVAAPTEGEAPAEGTAVTVEVSEEEALQDDILLVIDLPIAADDARDAGLEEAEIDEAIDAADAAAVSCGDMTEVLADEAEQIRGGGKKKAFGQWVKLQIAEGVRGKELAAKIKERKDELKAMTDEEKAALQAKLEEQGKKNREHRKALHAKRKELRDGGKPVVLAGEDRHAALVAKANERHAAAKAEWKAAKKADKLDRREDKLDKREDKLDALEDKQDGEPGSKEDKLEDKIDKLEDKQEKLEDRKEKLEDKKDKAEEKKDAKDAKGDHDGHKKGN